MTVCNHDDDSALATALERDGWGVADAFLPAAACAELSAECRQLDAAGDLVAAATGRTRIRSPRRGDRTHWFEPAALSAPQAGYWQAMTDLRRALNRRLFLGLDQLEAHYAVYPPGTGYARHLDRLHGSAARVVSAVLYLNADWSAPDGGALRLYLPHGAQHDIAPLAGRLVLFLSAEFEHEVLPATRSRYSIAGWFRRQPI